MFARFGSWCHDRRGWVLLGWVLVLVLSGVASSAAGNAFREEFNMPDVESRRGLDILEDDFGGDGAGVTGTIVFRAEQGVDDPEVRSGIEALLAEVRELDDVTAVQSPYEEVDGERPLVASQGDAAGQIAYANIEMPSDMEWARGQEIRDAIRAQAPDLEGVQLELGGFIFADFEEPSSEILGVAFAMVILIVAFGSVLAMGLPIGVALFGIGIGSMLITLLSHVFTIPDMASFIGIMIGLGVGIDYALLIVTRYREQLHAGHSVRESVAIAMDTAGRSVLFAGTTVVISLLGMLVMGVTFVQGLAIGAAAVVAITVMASFTLLPALIGFAGDRIEITRWRGLIAAGLVAIALVGVGLEITPLTVGLPLAVVVLLAGLALKPLQKVVVHRPPRPLRETIAYRWSRAIQHRPWAFTVAGTVLLLVLAVPLLSLRLGFSDESNYSEETSTRRAYDLLVEGFGPGFNGPMILASHLDGDPSPDALNAITEAVRRDPGVAFVSDVAGNGPDPASSLVGADAVRWQVMHATGPQDAATNDLVNRLRSDILPSLESDAGLDVAVTGTVPVNIDFSDYLASRMPYFFGAVLGLSFLLLMIVFRSLLVPLKAVIMNLLSISAAYGVVVALFQWGWLSDITGVQPAPVEPWAPMMLFAIVFGLSMDYEVFLLSRIREEWRRSGDSRTSVADGLAATAKVITAAAAIMVFVFGAFILEDDRVIKLMGTGLAVAILLDATVVRMLLVPSTMELLGDRNWWLPRWLDRILPNLDVEGHGSAIAAGAHPPLDPIAPAADADGSGLIDLRPGFGDDGGDAVSEDESQPTPTGAD
ncbi:MAG: MMPL family transporter [Acidimicrobiales bacterium]|nr:MMPL family transporter [Acidimicrobiales bacterium]